VGASGKQSNLWLKEVRIYYRTIRALNQFCEKQFPALAAWANHELVACSLFAAATLDQRLSSQLASASEVDHP
jgi:hypothetical protein